MRISNVGFARRLLVVILAILIVTAGFLIAATPWGNTAAAEEGPGSAPVPHDGHAVFLPMVARTTSPRDGMVLVPAGTFQMGCDPAHNGGYGCYSGELPLHTVYLDAYYIDRTEVTLGQYMKCVTAGACTLNVWRPEPIYESHPMVFVTWYEARAYCQWADKRLPTEAEWEKAARGGNDTRPFPWGDQAPNCTLANFAPGPPCVGDTSSVGSYPAGASPYGALDMAGNVWEWVSDWFQSDYYSVSPYSNPTGPATGSYKVLRGGDWNSSSQDLLLVARPRGEPTILNPDLGFRCASAP